MQLITNTFQSTCSNSETVKWCIPSTECCLDPHNLQHIQDDSSALLLARSSYRRIGHYSSWLLHMNTEKVCVRGTCLSMVSTVTSFLHCSTYAAKMQT